MSVRPFSIAVPSDVLSDLRERDWHAAEARLNEHRHFTAPVGGIDVHFIHEPGLGPRPFSLLLSHGWPGSIVEFQELIPRLTDPARYGGSADDAFTVVAPSLPGYLLAIKRDVTAPANPDAEERRYLEQLRRWQREETGYQWIQGTRPQTLAFGLTDSPVGLAAWIIEKFRAWSDCDGDVERCFGRDTLLTNVMLYWVTGAIGSSFWPYYARMHEPWPIPDGRRIDVPTGYAAFPREILTPPRAWAERVYNVRRWTPMERGGHFAALEQPEALAHDIRALFRPLRS